MEAVETIRVEVLMFGRIEGARLDIYIYIYVFAQRIAMD